MKTKRFAIEQITAILKQAELGTPVADLCRKFGISEQSFYLWKKVYGAMEPSEARDGKQLRGDDSKRKRVYRIYTEEGLALRRKRPWRHVSAVHRLERSPVQARDEVWSMDFVSDQLADGRRFRTLTVVDIFTRGCMDIAVGQTLRAMDVVATLEQLRISRGVAKRICCDNGSEFVSRQMDLWAYANGVKIDLSRRGKPTYNAIIESFNGRFREQCLNAHWFQSKEDANEKIDAWRWDYNENWPRRSLKGLTPREFARQSITNQTADSQS